MPINIDPLKRHALCEEIAIQCELAIDQFDAVAALLKDEKFRQHRKVWAHLHAFFTHSAMVSKMLANPANNNPKAKERGEYLCKLLEVEVASPIFGRNARNNVEHQDERLDIWIDQDGASLLEVAFDDRSGYDFMTSNHGDGRPRKFIRQAMIVDEMVFVSEGRNGPEETPLLPVVEELRLLRKKSEQVMASNDKVHRIG